VALTSEFRALCFLGRCSTTWAMSSTVPCFCVQFFWEFRE
jgi:hypothetical protein